MSTETFIKKRGRPKRVTLEEAVVLIDKEQAKPIRVSKAKPQNQIPRSTADVPPASSANKKTYKGSELDKSMSSPVLTPAALSPASKRVAKKSALGKEAPNSSIQHSKILGEADAFVRVSKECTTKALEFLESHQTALSKDLAQKPSSGEEDPENLATHKSKQRQVTVTDSGQRRELTSNANQSTGQRPLFDEPLNGAQPLPVPDERLSGSEAKAESSQRQREDESISTTRQATDVSCLPVKLVVKAPAHQPPVDTPQPSKPLTSLMANSSLPTISTSKQSESRKSASTAPTQPPIAPFVTGGFPTPTSTPNQIVGNAPSASKPLASYPPSSSVADPSNPPPPQPPSTPKAKSKSSLRVPTANYPSGQTPKPPMPPAAPRPRPTQLPYDQLRKDPAYKALGRKWTAVLVGIPFVVWSSYELFRRVQVSREERGREELPGNGGL